MPGLAKVVVEKVGQVFSGFPRLVARGEIPGDDVSDHVLVTENSFLVGAEGDGVGPPEIEIGDAGEEDEVAQMLHLEEGPKGILP